MCCHEQRLVVLAGTCRTICSWDVLSGLQQRYVLSFLCRSVRAATAQGTKRAWGIETMLVVEMLFALANLTNDAARPAPNVSSVSEKLRTSKEKNPQNSLQNQGFSLIAA